MVTLDNILDIREEITFLYELASHYKLFLFVNDCETNNSSLQSLSVLVTQKNLVAGHLTMISNASCHMI